MTHRVACVKFGRPAGRFVGPGMDSARPAPIHARLIVLSARDVLGNPRNSRRSRNGDMEARVIVTRDRPAGSAASES